MDLKRSTVFLFLGFFLPVLAGCASVKPRAALETLTHARIAVETAENAQAGIHAPDLLRRAYDALAIAKDAYAHKVYPRTLDFAKKAALFAAVAKARTEQKIAEQKVADLREQIDQVRAQSNALMKTTGGPQAVTGNARPQTTFIETATATVAAASAGLMPAAEPAASAAASETPTAATTPSASAAEVTP